MRAISKYLTAIAMTAGLILAGCANTKSDEEASSPTATWSSEEIAAYSEALEEVALEKETIAYAGALHNAKLVNYSLAVYDNEVKRQEAERIAAAQAAAAAAAAAAQQASYSTPSSSAPSYSGGGGGGAGGNLASIRACESGGNYSTNTGNGYYGAYQFDQQTWNSVGGSGNPANASPGEQDQRAQALIAQRGTSPWPNCG